MNVVILCGGNGTRLSEYTSVKPKSMVEIGDIPLLLHIMSIYSFYGYKKFILAVGYKGNYIKEFFHNFRVLKNDLRIRLDGKTQVENLTISEEFKDWEIDIIDTGINTPKLNRIEKVKKYINSDNFHLTYGDGLGNINIRELTEFHKGHRGIATITAVCPPVRFGQITLDNNTVTSFEEKKLSNNEFINGGFFVFNKEGFFEYSHSSGFKSFEFDFLKSLSLDKKLKAFVHTDFWQCMDNIKDKEYLESLANSENIPWRDLKC